MDSLHGHARASQSPDQDMRWCAGLPGVGQAPLSPAQRSLLQRVYSGARWRLVAYALVVLVLLPTSLATGYALRLAFGPHNWVPLAFSMAVFFFALPLAVAKTLVHAKLTWPLRRDISAGTLQLFEGTIADAHYEDEDPDVFALVSVGTLVRGGQMQRLGVLPNSARLLHVNGRDVLPERRLHVATTATTPTHALRYSLPPDVKQAFGVTHGLKRRRFGKGERTELNGHIARLTALPWTLVVLTGFMAITISMWVVKGVSSYEQVLGFGWVVAWFIVAARHVRSYLLARRLEDDLDVGWLLSWEPPDTSAQSDVGAGLPFSCAEVLPVSQMDWMIDGKPAPWRRVIQRA